MTPTKLRSARKAAGLTQREAGALIGASAAQISQYETGFRNISKHRFELFKMKLSGKVFTK